MRCGGRARPITTSEEWIWSPSNSFWDTGSRFDDAVCAPSATFIEDAYRRAVTATLGELAEEDDGMKWRLRMAAAQREVWTGAELRRLLAEKSGLEMSAASVSALLTKEPGPVKLSTLTALCTALECTPTTCSRWTPHR